MSDSTRVLAQEALNTLTDAGGNRSEAARRLGLPRKTFYGRIEIANRLGLKPGTSAVKDPKDSKILEGEVKRLRAELANAQADALTAEQIKRKIVGLKSAVEETAAPEWTQSLRSESSAPGVPTLFLSDLHWGEVVDAKQINGVNEYNLAIAHRRLDAVGESAVHLLKILDPKMRYPGIVLPLGGDMISGNIHDELSNTNELNTMPTVLDLYGRLVCFITYMANTFGRVFLPCVTGNHGRDTHKIYAKDRHHTSFDWLLYCFLAKHFENDKRVTFFIPDGSDAYYKIYDHRYLLTHGDQFRGGDGMIGALGPIIRGDHKKRSRNAQIDMEYDTLLMGHWHQLIQLARLIVNGSLKGYDEYAYAGNFGFEQPQQALWVTHPKYRITYRMPVLADRQRSTPKTSWVSVPA